MLIEVYFFIVQTVLSILGIYFTPSSIRNSRTAYWNFVNLQSVKFNIRNHKVFLLYVLLNLFCDQFTFVFVKVVSTWQIQATLWTFFKRTCFIETKQIVSLKLLRVSMLKIILSHGNTYWFKLTCFLIIKALKTNIIIETIKSKYVEDKRRQCLLTIFLPYVLVQTKDEVNIIYL